MLFVLNKDDALIVTYGNKVDILVDDVIWKVVLVGEVLDEVSVVGEVLDDIELVVALLVYEVLVVVVSSNFLVEYVVVVVETFYSIYTLFWW